MNSLNEQEKKALEYIAETYQKKGYPPTTREIGKKAGVPSSATAHTIIQSLVKKGFIVKEAGEPRTIALTEKAEELLYRGEREKIRNSIAVLEVEAKNSDSDLLKDAIKVAIRCMKDRVGSN